MCIGISNDRKQLVPDRLLSQLKLFYFFSLVNERGDVKGYLRVAVQAILGKTEGGKKHDATDLVLLFQKLT